MLRFSLSRRSLRALFMPVAALAAACSHPATDESEGAEIAAAQGIEKHKGCCHGSTLSVAVSADAELRHDFPSTNYGGAAIMQVGAQKASAERLALLKFNVAAVPAGALITSAKITLHGGNASFGSIGVHRVTAPWVESTVTWSTFNNAYASPASSTFTDDGFAAGDTTFDALPAVQSWVSGAAPNHGILLKKAAGSPTSVATFKTRESSAGPARLDICYEPPPKSPCAGVVCQPLDACHAAGVCDPGTGVCSNPLKPNGAACDDHNACTTNDTCQSGVCTGGAPLTCAAAHGSAACVGGGCELTSCNDGYRDCDGDPANGCEIDARADITHCGACDLPCMAPPHAAPVCANGACSFTCEAGFADCDHDPQNGCEVALGTAADCASCGDACASPHAAGVCVAGACALGPCAPGFADCDGNPQNGCETALDTALNCGGCGNTCVAAHAASGCAGGVCTVASCDPGFGDCDGNAQNGCETALDTTQSCGACGKVCSAPNGVAACLGGACGVGACSPGFGDCDGNPQNGCEAALDTLLHCGACGKGCAVAHGTPACSGGSCVIQSCDAGYGDCDGNPSNGCEAALDAFGTCGGTVCDAAHGNCDGNPQNGCETALTTPQNCGACGVVCVTAHGTPACDHGACAVAACDPGWANCDCSLENGCEANTQMDHDNCGGCGVLCAAGEACVGGSCQ